MPATERLALLSRRLREIHAPYAIFGECQCPERAEDECAHLTEELEDGSWTCMTAFKFWVCGNCCAGGRSSYRDYRSDACYDWHEHGPGLPVCETIAALDDIMKEKET